MYKILCNLKGTKSIDIQESHLETIEKYSLFCDLLDSNGIVDESVLDKLRLNVRSMLDGGNSESDLLDLCRDVLFHDWMKALGLHQLILTYIDWQNEKLESLKPEIETETEA